MGAVRNGGGVGSSSSTQRRSIGGAYRRSSLLAWPHLASLVRVDGVDEGDLLEAAVGDGDADLPAIVDLLEGDGGGDVVVEGDVVLEGLDLDAVAVEEDLELLALCAGHRSRDVVGAAGEEADGSLVEFLHLEPLEVGGEGDHGVVGLVGGLELGD